MSLRNDSINKIQFTIFEARKPRKKDPRVEKLRKHYQHHIALEMMKNPRVTQQELAKSLHTSVGTIQRNVSALKENSVIQRVGGKRFGFWTVEENEIPEEAELIEIGARREDVRKEKEPDESE